MPARPAERPAPAARPDLRPVASGDGGSAHLGLGADALALPSELAHILRVPLPLAAHRQRQAAAGFAVEELIAEPLEASHVVLGPELGRGEYLVVVVAHREMAAWAGRAAPGQRLVPDVLALPVPADGCCSVREAGGRVLVRRADGTGYATRTDRLEGFWRADGAPQVVIYGGGRLPEQVPVGAPGLMPPGPTPEAARFDLLQGAHARTGRGRRGAVKRLLAVIALALAAHGAVLTADTLALRRIAEARGTALRSALSARVPDLPPTLPLNEALLRALPAAPAARGAFLPLLARAADVLSVQEVTLRDLSYSAEDGGLSLSVEAPDLPALQRVEAELRAAGLSVSPGVATTGESSAEVQYRVTGTGG